MEEAFKQQRLLTKNKGTIYSVIMGQCSHMLLTELRSKDRFKSINDDQTDVVELLSILKSIIYRYDSNEHPFLAITKSKVTLYDLRQYRR